MKKKMLTVLAILVLLLLTVPAVYAQDATMSIKVTPSVSTAKVGDTIQYTVYATGEGITGLQFNLTIPEGMTYVTGSASIPEGLQESLGWYLMDWTENGLMWTGCDHLADTFEEDTVILTFACTVDTEGEYEIGMYDHEAFDPAYDGFAIDLTVGAVTAEADPGSEDPVVKPTLTLKAPTLEFKDMISVIAFYTAENTEDVVEMGMITYDENVTEWSVETADHVIPGAEYEAGSGRYFSSSQGIHAKYLGDTVYLACYAKLTDGSYAYTKLASYSPIQYANSQLKGSDANLKQLVVSMLNYGAAAQSYFSHNTETLANSALTAEQLSLPESYRDDMVTSVPAASAEKQGIFANNQGFLVRKPAVSFEEAFSINYFFTPAYAPVDGITLYYWTEADFAAADVLAVDNATGSVKMTGTGTEQYRGDIEGIAAKNLSQAIYVAAVYSDGTTTWTSGVLGYSIGAYCGSQATKGGTMADLAMATAVYGYHAKQYFG